MFNFIKNFLFINLIFINILSLSSSWAYDDACDDVMDVETPNAGMLALNIGFESVNLSPIHHPKPKRLLEERNFQSSTPYKKARTSEEVICASLSSKSKSESFMSMSASFQDDSRDENFSPVKSFLSLNSALSPNSKERYKNKNKNDKDWRKEKRDGYFEDVIIPKIEQQIENNIEDIKTLCEAVTLSHTTKILSYIANKAVVAYSEKLEENITTLGTHRHKFCERYIHALQERGYLKHLKTEVSYFEGQESTAKGCVRCDVYWPACEENSNKGRVYDYKFCDEESTPYLKMNNRAWMNNVPGGKEKNALIFITPKYE